MRCYSVLVSVRRDDRVLYREAYINSETPTTDKEVEASIMSKIPVDIRYLTKVVDINPVNPNSIQQASIRQGLLDIEKDGK